MPHTDALPDEDLLLSADPEDFGRFYDRHVHAVLGQLSRCTRDAGLAADLAAATFATALVGRRRYRIGTTTPAAWLFGLARQRLIEANRPGGSPTRRQRRLGMQRVALESHDRELIAALGRDAPAGDMPPAARTLDDGPHIATSDFVSVLRAELIAAAAREAHRRLPVRPLVPALAVASLLALVAAAVFSHAWSADGHGAARPWSDLRPLFDGTVYGGARYRSEAVDPPIELTFRDRRWVAELTDPRRVVIAREAAQPGGGARPKDPIGALIFARETGPVYAPRPRDIGRAVRRAPRDLMNWLRVHPDIDARPIHRTRLAGHHARVMDFRFSFTRPAHDASECRGLGYACTALGPGGDAHRNGEHDRLWQVKTTRGPLYVSVVGIDAAAFRETMAAAAPTLDGLKIDD